MRHKQKMAWLGIGLGAAVVVLAVFRQHRAGIADGLPEQSEPGEPRTPQRPSGTCGKGWRYWLLNLFLAALAAGSMTFTLRNFQESGLSVAEFLAYLILPAIIPAAAFWRVISKRDKGGAPVAAFIVIAWLAVAVVFGLLESFGLARGFLQWFGALMGMIAFFTVTHRPLIRVSTWFAEAYYRNSP
ncbi:hypothetical protein [Candidatus Poriferisocius sp.]|uniref:hypothetical protein n=1 Tax=Candidatus Poriferisocius sp. TaxID=3101276 RepID=UPI003B021B11